LLRVRDTQMLRSRPVRGSNRKARSSRHQRQEQPHLLLLLLAQERNLGRLLQEGMGVGGRSGRSMGLGGRMEEESRVKGQLLQQTAQKRGFTGSALELLQQLVLVVVGWLMGKRGEEKGGPLGLQLLLLGGLGAVASPVASAARLLRC
jgi:hypothetical protein